jgi:hypothetical protein
LPWRCFRYNDNDNNDDNNNKNNKNYHDNNNNNNNDNGSYRRHFHYRSYYHYHCYHNCHYHHQVVLYATAGVQLWSWDFWAMLIFQEVASVVYNVSIACAMWRRQMRLMRNANEREDAPDKAWNSRLTLKLVLHSVAELMGILTVYAVAAMETLFMYMGDGSALCAVAHCRAQTVDFQLLGLYGVVLIVRLLVMFGEFALLFRVLEYCQRLGASRVYPLQAAMPAAASRTVVDDSSLEHGRDVDDVDDVDERNYSVVTSNGSVNDTHAWLKYEVRKLLGGDNAVATHALMVAIFVLVVSYASSIRNGF